MGDAIREVSVDWSASLDVFLSYIICADPIIKETPPSSTTALRQYMLYYTSLTWFIVQVPRRITGDLLLSGMEVG
jgi:hypothetical protein